MAGSMSRRDFLKSTAALMAALSLSSWARGTQTAHARGRTLDLPQPSLQEAPSALASGALMADIAAGWDGTLWSVDTDGVPHLFDPLEQSWHTFGAGFDAVAWLDGTTYAFQGESVLVNGVLESSAGLWSALPASFLLQVDGAAAFAGELYLFQGGRYVAVAGGNAPVALTSVAGWPMTAAWADGVVDAVGVAEVATTGVAAPAILLFRSGEYVALDPTAKTVSAPQPITALVTDPALLAVVNAGFGSLRVAAGTGGADVIVVQDARIWTLPAGGALGSTYANALAPTRLPRLARAPEGRLGALWGVTADAQVYTHDGTQWSSVVTPAELSGSTVSLSVGADGTVVVVQTGVGPGARIYQYDAASAAWALLDTLAFYWSSTVEQVAVGSAEQIWLRNADQTVWKVMPGEEYPMANLGAGATHVSANADGTLWHVDGQSANVYRYISEAQSPSQAIGSGGSPATRVTSIGFGDAHLLTNANQTVTLYDYSSPYVFKTSTLFPGGTPPNPLLTRLASGAGMLFMVLSGDAPAAVAVDSKNGVQLWSVALHAQTLIFDAGRHLVYVPADDGTLYALDATTGAAVWTFAYSGVVSGQPALVGGNLYLATDTNLYALNLDTARAQAATNTPVTPLWSSPITPFGDPDNIRTAAFVTSNHIYLLQINALLGKAGAVKLTALEVQNGSLLWATTISVMIKGSDQPLGLSLYNAMSSLGQAVFEAGAQPEPAILLMAYNAIVAIRLADQGQTTNYVEPGSNNGYIRFAQLQDVVYAGDFVGNLYAYDLALNPVPNSPIPAGNGMMLCGPTAMIDADGNMLIVGGFSNDQSLIAYSPATGNVTQLATNHATPADIVIDNHGIALVATNSDWDADNGQLFGIRLDNALQADLAFVIESELMQDFDGASTQPTLQATARYQTHVTV
ncbi:MAG: PQQ-binding-like beta-propeller repeat protein, partial [Caldilineaceae bacterium]|nr:PQQ-binding-like beta-propeller repeat protein [Caldilineaceae bacterium]